MYAVHRVPLPGETLIYALIEPGTEDSDDPVIRYVGQTQQGLETRLSQHIADAKANRMENVVLRAWILKCLRRRKRPVIQRLEATSVFSADEAERLHIERLGRFHDLLNIKDNPRRKQARPFPERYLKEVS